MGRRGKETEKGQGRDRERRTPEGRREGEKEDKGWEREGRRLKKDKGGNQEDQEERRRVWMRVKKTGKREWRGEECTGGVHNEEDWRKKEGGTSGTGQERG